MIYNIKAKPLTVTELTHKIKNLLEANFLNIAVEGEISNMRYSFNGHLYFTLKDTNASISAVIFKNRLGNVKFKLENGLKVIASGRITVYDPRGEYQINIENIMPAGLGLLQLELEKLKEKLRNAGWFDETRKRKIPWIPENIGIITSPTGAALQDILNTIERRFPKVKIFLYPVTVQGENAKYEINEAFEYFNQNPIVDVIILARGGGSLEDLWAFNEELTAQAIYNSAIPVITGIGHETDFTISDMVADLRAPTPTAAVERAVPDYKEVILRLLNLQETLTLKLKNKISLLSEKLNTLKNSRIFLQPTNKIDYYKLLLDDYKNRLGNSLIAKHSYFKKILVSIDLEKKLLSYLSLKKIGIKHLKKIITLNFQNRTKSIFEKLDYLDKKMQTALKNKIDKKKIAVKNLNNNLIHLNPLNILERGYAAVFSKDDKPLTTIKNLNISDNINVRLKDGNIQCEVKNIKTQLIDFKE